MYTFLRDVIIMTGFILLGTYLAPLIAAAYGMPYVVGFGWGALMFRVYTLHQKVDRIIEDKWRDNEGTREPEHSSGEIGINHV